MKSLCILCILLISSMSLYANQTLEEYEQIMRENKVKYQKDKEKYNNYISLAKEFENSKSYLSRTKAYQYYFKAFYINFVQNDLKLRKYTLDKIYKLSNREWMVTDQFAAMTYENKNTNLITSISFKYDHAKRWYMDFQYETKGNIYITEFRNLYVEGGSDSYLITKACTQCVRSNRNNHSLITVPLSTSQKDIIFKTLKKSDLVVINYTTNLGKKHFKFALKNVEFALDKLEDNYRQY